LQPVSRAQHVVELDIIECHQLVRGGVKALRDPRERVAIFHDINRVGCLSLRRVQTYAKKQGNQKENSEQKTSG